MQINTTELKKIETIKLPGIGPNGGPTSSAPTSSRRRRSALEVIG